VTRGRDGCRLHDCELTTSRPQAATQPSREAWHENGTRFNTICQEAVVSKTKQSGFTLIEIAIVLVIIGLLLGGVLKGQELINSAKVKNLATDFRNIPLYRFQGKG
jgi:prepilin-type N-terminal cleavage/methylation domain-containing protein